MGKGRKWVCSLKADGCGRHEVQNSAFPRGMRHRPEEPRGTPRAVGNALRSEGREKIMSSVSVRAYFGESRRCGVGFSFGVDRFSMRALAFGGPAPFGNGGTGRKRCEPRRTCGYFMKHQSVCSPERWDCLAVEQPLSLRCCRCLGGWCKTAGLGFTVSDRYGEKRFHASPCLSKRWFR